MDYTCHKYKKKKGGKFSTEKNVVQRGEASKGELAALGRKLPLYYNIPYDF